MTKLNLNDVTGFSTSMVSTINANNALIEAAIENTVSRDGTSPNSMSGDLDLNDNDVLNVNQIDAVGGSFSGTLSTQVLVVGGYNLVSLVEDAVEAAESAEDSANLALNAAFNMGFNWQGNWTTATTYTQQDGVYKTGYGSYICTEDHTSGASNEPGVGASWQDYWSILAADASIDDTALTSIISSATAKPTLVGGDIFPLLDSEASSTLKKTTADDIAEYTLSYITTENDFFLNSNFIDEDSFATDSATKAPSQQSVKAYVDNKSIAISQLPEATTANWRANTADKVLSTDQTWAAAEEVTLTDAATIGVDMSTFINAKVTLGGNRTLGNPTNTKNGQSGVIRVIQDGSGSRTLAFGSNYEFAGGSAPTLSTGAADEDLLFYYVISSTRIFISSALDIS